MLFLLRLSIVMLLVTVWDPHSAFAGGVIAIRTIPETPLPNTSAKVLLESFVVDVKNAHITWRIDGRTVADGFGLTTYELTTPPSGKEVLVEALIFMPDGKEFKESIRFTPSTVDILWQADTYVPPFYKGKALPTHRSTIYAVALPEFASGEDVKRQKYQWNINDATRAGEGTGVFTTRVVAPWEGSRINLSVNVETQDRVVRASRTVAIRSAKPEVVFYEHSPLYGVRYHQALLGRVAPIGTEYTLHAAPYFFSKPDREYGYLSYGWHVNAREVQLPPGIQEDLTLLGNDPAVHNVFVKIYSTKRVTQVAASSVAVDFSKNE